jgi:5-methylcytosine-specific restriction protein A
MMESSTWPTEEELVLSRLLNPDVAWSPEGSRVDPYDGIRDEAARAYIWGRIRHYVLERDDYTCLRCGADLHNGQAQVHHIIWRRYNGTDHPMNLMTVCDKCHKAIHQKRRMPPLREVL